jgi:ATP synthase protein I
MLSFADSPEVARPARFVGVFEPLGGPICRPPSREMGVSVTEPGRRSPLSVGVEWASRASTLGLEFALPPLLGALVDRKLGSAPAGILVGMVLGFAVGMMHILRIARDASRPT